MRAMRWVIGLLIAGALVLGVLGAVTAYVPPLSLADDRLVGLELNAAVAVRREDGKRDQLAKKGDVISPELLALLRGAGVERVRVKQFSLERWTGKTWFALGFVGLIVGAGLVRAARRSATALGAAAVSAAAHELAIENMQRAVRELNASSLRGGELLREIMARIGEVQKRDMPAFVAARAELVASLGLSGYAQLMDSFAAGERAMNRAWSAAADGHETEAMASLQRAEVLLTEARSRLARA
jgi:hypothetical protein